MDREANVPCTVIPVSLQFEFLKDLVQFSFFTQQLNHQAMKKSSLVPRPPPFFVLRFLFSIIHGVDERKKQGRPGNTYHVNDVWWTRGGCMGGVTHQPTRVQ